MSVVSDVSVKASSSADAGSPLSASPKALDTPTPKRRRSPSEVGETAAPGSPSLALRGLEEADVEDDDGSGSTSEEMEHFEDDAMEGELQLGWFVEEAQFRKIYPDVKKTSAEKENQIQGQARRSFRHE